MSKKTNSKSKIGCLPLIIVATIILFIIGGIGSCVGGDDEKTTTTTTEVSSTVEDTTKEKTITIESIEFSDSNPLELNVGDSEYSYIRVVYDDEYSEKDILFVSSDESIATITLNRKRNSLVYFDIEAVGTGTATIYAQTTDGTVKSEEITVIVTGEDADEITKISTTTKSSNEATANPETTTQKVTTSKSSSQTVYRTPSGKRYHLDPDCGGKNSYSISLDDAINSGLTPCKTCAQ